MKLFYAALFAVAGWLFCWLLSQTPLGQRADSLFYDGTMRWRAARGDGPTLDPRILILAIDEKTRQEKPLPLELWLPNYAKIVDASFRAGALGLGIDIIPTYAPPELLLPFHQGVTPWVDKVRMVLFLDEENDLLVRPNFAVQAVIGEDRLALSNLGRDRDGIVRRQVLSDLSHKEGTYPFFMVSIAELLDEKPDSLPERLLINYHGPQGSFPRLSVSQLLDWIEQGDQAKLEQALKGKILLLGGTALADQDYQQTPFPRFMSGVEIHANILNTLLTGQFLRESTCFTLLLAALLPCAIVSIWWPARTSLLATLSLAAGWLGAVTIAFSYSLVVTPSLSAVPAFLTTAGLGYLYRFQTVERERRRIRAVFGRYVSKDVMEAMLSVPEDHKPENAVSQKVTVMFSDINNFSTHCETLEPEEVTRRLNLYFNEMTHIIYAHKGTIIRFIGDEFMVLFGAPTRAENSEELAVLAGVKMVDRLAELRAQDPEERNGFYHVKIGIHVGSMILTSIGNELRSDYNCIGDSTNMAARVLSLTKPLDATVLISEDVKKRVEHRQDLLIVDKGVHPVKGRAGEMHVYDVSSREPKS